jgi:ABC-type lipoprotein export system ATPase subunit
MSYELRKRALELLENVGLSERLTHFPNQLSGGEQQRVAIARALINKPSLFLCDEPTGNLDSKNSDEIIALVKKINLKNQMAVVLVTHNAELAKTAQIVYYLRDGVLVN